MEKVISDLLDSIEKNKTDNYTSKEIIYSVVCSNIAALAEKKENINKLINIINKDVNHLIELRYKRNFKVIQGG